MAPQQPQPPKSRKTLYIMISVCVVLALAFGGSAYFFFFSGDSPRETVEQYINYAQDEDFAAARDLAAEGASEGIQFKNNAEGMETMRRWFSKDTMEWKVREDKTSGSKSTVIVDKTLKLPNYDEPVDMRWDYSLKRESGSWKVDRAKIMTVVESDIAEPGECVQGTGFAYEPADCGTASGSESVIIFNVTDKVSEPLDCPNPKGTMAETKDHEILCLEETETVG